MTDTIKLRNPDGKVSSEGIVPFATGIPVEWKPYLAVVWVHQHRLLGLLSPKSKESARGGGPFYLHEVCTWISQVAVTPTRDGTTQIQSFRAIVRYDNLPKPLKFLKVTQSHAITMAIEQSEEICNWLIDNYKQQVLPSDIQIVTQMELPGA